MNSSRIQQRRRIKNRNIDQQDASFSEFFGLVFSSYLIYVSLHGSLSTLIFLITINWLEQDSKSVQELRIRYLTCDRRAHRPCLHARVSYVVVKPDRNVRKPLKFSLKKLKKVRLISIKQPSLLTFYLLRMTYLRVFSKTPLDWKLSRCND